VGTQLDSDGRADLLAEIVAEAGIEPALADAGPDVEAVRRSGEAGTWTFIINHGSESTSVSLAGTDVLTGTDATSGMDLAGGGVAVIRHA
jgi:beta-galactosidase